MGTRLQPLGIHISGTREYRYLIGWLGGADGACRPVASLAATDLLVSKSDLKAATTTSRWANTSLGSYQWDSSALWKPRLKRGSGSIRRHGGQRCVTTAVHSACDSDLVKSIKVGSTHFGLRGDGAELRGPAPDFFFIPDVAEAAAAQLGQNAYHQELAAAWHPFVAWAADFTSINESTGPQAMQDAYLQALSGSHNQGAATVLAYP